MLFLFLFYVYNVFSLFNIYMIMDDYILSTDKFAEKHGLQPNTIRMMLYKHGHFRGVKPNRALNGRLLWPDVFVEKEKKNAKR